MQYDETFSLGGQSPASHSSGHPVKPRDANDIFREEGADGLRRALETAPRIATSAASSHRDGNRANPSAADGASAGSDWPQLDGAAMHGLAGDIVRTIEPHSEADPVALLVQLLACAGSVIGSRPYYQVEGSRHHSNLFAVLVGATSKARKGTSFDRVFSVVREVDETWCKERNVSGLSSGEGLISEVRNETKAYDKKAKEEVIVDLGVADKRLLVQEPEFAGALRACERHGNTLSPVIRQAWDGRTLRTLTKNNQLTASDPHISIVAHITTQELRASLSGTDMANGFANRFLVAMVKRSKTLPFGGMLNDAAIHRLGGRLRAAIETAQRIGRVGMTEATQHKWSAVYPALSEGQDGLLGAIVARAEAQVVRLALVYALLDGVTEIDEQHLDAALALWEYCEASAAYIFGSTIGDPIADEIHRALQQARAAGLSRTAIRDIFGRNRSGDRIGAALQLLLMKGRARMERIQTAGRPAETWFAVERQP